jgi:uncharacterized protein YjbJ (UPF0337 family)
LPACSFSFSDCLGEPTEGVSQERPGDRHRIDDVRRQNAMSNADDAKGRVKEAVGDLTDDKDLKREGKIDRAEGAAKEKLDKAADKVKDAVTSDD